MRFNKFLSLLLVLGIASLTYGAPATKRDAQAISVVSQSLTAMGLATGPALETVAHGSYTDRTGTVSDITIETAGTDRIREDLGTEHSFVTNGGRGFAIVKGVKHSLPRWTTKYRRAEHLPSLSALCDVLNPKLNLQYLGVETVNGHSAHHIRLSMSPSDGAPAAVEDLMSEFHVWIDQTSLLVVKTRSFYFSPDTPQNRTAVDTYLTSYRQQGTATVPFRIASYISGKKDSEITLTDINLKAAISDSDFQ